MSDFANLWTVALQAPLSMRFSKQEHWSGLPFPTPGDLLNPGIELTSPVPPAMQLGSLWLSYRIREALSLQGFWIIPVDILQVCSSLLRYLTCCVFFFIYFY